MNIDEIKDLIKAVSDSELSVFDYREGDVNISLQKGNAQLLAAVENNETGNIKVGTVTNNAESNIDTSDKELEKPVEGVVVKSPLVGTVYLSDEEGGTPLVSVGDTVKRGQTLAIVEAMKLMNEIVSELDGVVKKVLVENGQTVEYDQGLFVIG
jgi:acetyl-CoA carboxylase biotin carboxyl carrier protein